MKTCLECKSTLPLELFYVHKKGTLGRGTKCIECAKEYSRVNNAKRRRPKAVVNDSGFTYNLAKIMKDEPIESINVAMDYFYNNITMDRIADKYGLTGLKVRVIIHATDKLLKGHVNESIYIDEMTLPGCSYKDLYIPVCDAEVVGKLMH